MTTPTDEWETEAATLWRDRAGEDALLCKDGAAFVFALPNTDGSMRAWPAPDGSIDRAPADIVASAAKALGLPAWGHVGALAKAWRERAGEAARADLEPGRWQDAGTYRAVPCLTFNVPAAGCWSVDEIDVRGWSLADLISMAADECGLTSTPPAPMPARVDKRKAAERRAAA